MSAFDPLRKSRGSKCCDAQRGFSTDVLGCDPRLDGSLDDSIVAIEA